MSRAFDLNFYQTISENLARKEQASYRAAFAYLGARFRRSRSKLRMLDVGAGTGRLYRLEIWRRFARRRSLAVDAIEPHPFGIRSLRSLENRGVLLNVFPTKFEEWKSPRQPQYDIILCSHVFYHFARQKWPALIRLMQSRLRRRGAIVLIAASNKSEVYAWASSIKGNTSEDRAFRFGEFVFAEDIESELTAMGCFFQSVEVTAPVFLVSRSKLISMRSQVTRFLSFMYREPPSRVNASFDWARLESLPMEEGLPFVNGKDKVIFITSVYPDRRSLQRDV